jgi:glutathione S-transferase
MAAPFGSAAAQPAPQDSEASSNTVIFYNYALAFNPAKARLALEEKRIPYVEQKIDLFNGESLEPWYLKINPSASAPSLVVGNDKITQSVEIIRWADRQGGAPLGGESVDRAFVDQWLNKVDAWDGNLFAAANTPAGAALKVSTEYKIKVAEANAKKNPDMAKLYEEKISTMRKSLIENPSNESLAKENRAQLQALVDEAEARLTSNKFLAGDAYSAADVIFTPVLYRIYQLKKDSEFLNGKSNVARYYEELQQRPSYKTVFATSDSPLASAKEVVPSIGKVVVDKVTGKYNQ